MDEKEFGDIGEQKNGKKDIYRQYLNTPLTAIVHFQYTECPLEQIPVYLFS